MSSLSVLYIFAIVIGLGKYQDCGTVSWWRCGVFAFICCSWEVVFDLETLKTADPFLAGWFLSAYFLWGYGDEGKGKSGLWKAVAAAAKSWSLGIPLGLIITAVTLGHAPPKNFVIVTMGSTAVLLIGWRALFFSIFPNNKANNTNDAYKKGIPFELFELLT